MLWKVWEVYVSNPELLALSDGQDSSDLRVCFSSGREL